VLALTRRDGVIDRAVGPGEKALRYACVGETLGATNGGGVADLAEAPTPWFGAGVICRINIPSPCKAMLSTRGALNARGA